MLRGSIEAARCGLRSSSLRSRRRRLLTVGAAFRQQDLQRFARRPAAVGTMSWTPIGFRWTPRKEGFLPTLQQRHPSREVVRITHWLFVVHRAVAHRQCRRLDRPVPSIRALRPRLMVLPGAPGRWRYGAPAYHHCSSSPSSPGLLNHVLTPPTLLVAPFSINHHKSATTCAQMVLQQALYGTRPKTRHVRGRISRLGGQVVRCVSVWRERTEHAWTQSPLFA